MGESALGLWTGMKIAITGFNGFIGSHLSSRLEALGHQVRPLKRFCFMKGGESALQEALTGCGAVVNLAGAPINSRWTKARKRELYESRVMTTRRLVDAINSLSQPPGVMISTSAVGYYSTDGCHGESDGPEQGSFLSDLCQAWEAEAMRVHEGVRLVRSRFGVVLAPDGGVLPQMLRPARFGVTVAVGRPEHSFSWIALDDLVNALAYCLEREDISGPVNMTAPQRTSNGLFYSTVAEHFKTRWSLHLPDAVLQLLMGESSQVVTRGQCAIPETLLRTGFPFLCPDISSFFNKCFPPLP